ncbi:hypothetical protein C8J57DRAFT_1298431 [Mycena rebaudengoi]|nr:hypothetical protein C8J57DRAFT_1298431 [Mycena rebaudengoi]
MSVWCLDSCPHCDRVVEGTATTPMYSSSYASWHRISAWAQNVSPTPPLSTPIYLSPSKRILTPQYPTACLTSDSTISSNPSPVSPAPHSQIPHRDRVARRKLDRPAVPHLLWRPRALLGTQAPPPPSHNSQLHRLRKDPPLRLQHRPTRQRPLTATSPPVWWVSAAEQDSPRSGPPKHFVLQRGAPHPSRGRKPTRVIS